MSLQEIHCSILTISDRCSRGEMEDLSGPALASAVSDRGWVVGHRQILPDDLDAIAQRLTELADSDVPLILTTGGSGPGPRDCTPEATVTIADRLIPGLSELARARTGESFPRAYLSRGIAALRGRCLIINLPGSVRGACEMFDAIADLIPHALDVIHESPGTGTVHEPKPERGETDGRS